MNQPKSTEGRNPRTRGIGAKSTLEILLTILHEDSSVVHAVRSALPSIARAVDTIAESLRQGGSLFYIGAGTSGRLAVLDAVELPPTFGTPPRAVQALIAGGHRALTNAVEKAEDDEARGGRELKARGMAAGDVVAGISASGATRYVLGALEFARRKGAVTIALTCNSRAPITKLADIAIVTPTGPEVIAGSTRMKAGTAQKMVLNMLSTATMIRLGRVYGNWMIGVALTNRKLRARGLRILIEASGATVPEATQALRQSGYKMDAALIMLKTGASAREAQRLLRETHGDVYNILKRTRSSARGAREANG